MRHLIAIGVWAIILSACTVAGSPSAPSTSSPPSTGPAASLTPPPTLAPTRTPATTTSLLASVDVRPVATRPPAAGCTPADSAAAGLDRAMVIADVPIQFQFQSGGSRDDGIGWSDSVPGPTIRFGFGEHQVVEAGKGTVASLEPGRSVTLIDGRLELYRLDADDHAGDGAMPAAAVDLGGDVGGLDVPLPTEHGRWLLSVYAHWQTDCATGDGYVDLLLVTS